MTKDSHGAVPRLARRSAIFGALSLGSAVASAGRRAQQTNS